MVTCDKCNRRISKDRQIRGAFGFDSLCAFCFYEKLDEMDQRNRPDIGKPKSLKEWLDVYAGHRENRREWERQGKLDEYE